MIPSARLLPLSLAANLLLVGLLALRPSLAPLAVRDFFSRALSPETTGQPPAAHPSSAATPDPAHPSSVAVASLWSRLRTDNLRDYVARLRAAGFPAATIRALIEVELQLRYGSRLTALQDPDASVPFWKIPANQALNADADHLKEITGLQREFHKQLHDLLGDEFFADDESLARERRRYGHLSHTKISALKAIEDDYSDLERISRGTMQGVALPEDREASTLMRREKRADLAAVLTPEELAEYDLHTSSAASLVRSQIALFPATEEEYRTLVRLRLAVEEQAPAPPGGYYASEDTKRLTEALAISDTQLKAAFGDARYAEYVRDTNYDYRQLTKLARQEDLPPETIALTWNLRDTVSRESNRIMDDPSLDRAQKSAALQSLAQNTRVQFNQTLGPNAGPLYASVASSWLNAVGRGRAVTFVDGRPVYRNPPPLPPAPTR